MAQYTGTFSNLLEDSTQETSPKSSVDVEQSPQENTYQGTFSNLITPLITDSIVLKSALIMGNLINDL